MRQEDHFLQAILENPDDDTLRLIFADWLTESGDPRGEFIQIQIALARDTPREDRPTLHRREKELLEQYGSPWLGPWQNILAEWHYRRGFVETASMLVPRFVEQAKRLFSQMPIRGLRLFWGAESPHARATWMSQICVCPQLARLRTLDLSHGYLGSPGAEILARCEHLEGLEMLDLASNHIGDRGIRAIAGATWFGSVQRLNLVGNDLTPRGLRALRAALEQMPAFALRTLKLERRRQTIYREVLDSPILRRCVEYADPGSIVTYDD